MAQLRQDYAKFVKLGAEIIALGPDTPGAFQRFWESEDMPFIGCADIQSQVADRYLQEFNLLKLGRMPAMFIIDRQGLIRFSHYGSSMADIPENEQVLAQIDTLNQEEAKVPTSSPT